MRRVDESDRGGRLQLMPSLVTAVLLGFLLLTGAILLRGMAISVVVIPWFVPMMNGILMLVAACVAYLAFGRFRVIHDTASYWIAVGSSGFAIGMLFNTLTFPVLLPSGSLFGHLQKTSVWIGSFSLWVWGTTLLLPVFTRWPGKESRAGERRAFSSWLAGFTFLNILFVIFEEFLPPMVSPGGEFTIFFRLTTGIFLMCISGTGALLSMRRYLRGGDNMSGYVALCQTAIFGVAALSLIEVARYDIWWFIQRILWVVGFIIILFGLLSEYLHLFESELEKSRLLRESEEKFRVIFQQAAVGIARVDFFTSCWIDVNGAFCRMLGYSREELLAIAWPEITHPEDLESDLVPFREMAAGRLQSYTVEKRFFHKNGSPVWARLTLSLVRDVRGVPAYEIAIIEDISEQKRAGKELRESESRFRGIFENAAVGIALLDREGRLLESNQKLCSLIGYSKGELFGVSFNEITHPDDREQDWSLYSRLMRGEAGSYELEKRYLRRDGTPFWVRVARSTPWDQRERPDYSIVVVQDVDDRRKAEEQLRYLTGLLRAITENTPDFMFVKDRQGRMLLANTATLNDLGLAAEEVIGRTDAEFLGGEAGRQIMENDRLVMEQGETVIFEEVPHPEGDRRVYLSTKSPYRDASGNVLGIVGVSRDITERKRTEQAVRESGKLLRTVLETLPVGVWILDSSNQIIMANNAAHEIWCGIGVEGFGEYKGWWSDSGRKIEPEEWAGARAIRGETSLNREIEIECFNGSRKTILDSGMPIRNERGEIAGAVMVNQDITALKQTERELRAARDQLEARVHERTEELRNALEKLGEESAERLQTAEELRRKEQLLMQQSRLAAMGEMLVNISHQWRQPLNVLGLILQELVRSHRRGSFSAEYLEARVARGRELIAHMSQTIDDFRNFLNPEKIRRSFSVREAVEGTLAIVRDSLRDVRVDVRAPGEEDVVIDGFRNEFAQAVMNILLNARDVLRERKVPDPRLTVTLLREAGRSVVTFADNGGGIAPEVIDKIFEPYFTTKEPDKGTGIGLFMTKMIIERNMGGRLSVRNTGEGAEFRIEV